MFKSLSKGERNVMSSSIPAKSQRDDNVLYSDKYNAEMGINSPKHLYMNNKHFINNGKEQEGEVERENPSTGRLGNDDIIASLKSDVTLPAVISVEKLSSLIARKRFLNTKDSVLSVIDNFRKRLMAFKGFLSLFVIRFITIFSVLSEITGIFRYGKKSHIGNPMECASTENLGNVRIPSLFSSFLAYLSYILRFRKGLWNNMIGNLVKEIKEVRRKEREYGVSLVGLLLNYVTYDLATLSKKRLGYDLATLWKRLWIQNISRFVYAFSWTYVLLAGVN